VKLKLKFHFLFISLVKTNALLVTPFSKLTHMHKSLNNKTNISRRNLLTSVTSLL